METPTRTRSVLTGLAALAVAIAGLTPTVPAHSATPNPPAAVTVAAAGNVIPDAGLRACLAEAMVRAGAGAPAQTPAGWVNGADPGVITAADVDRLVQAAGWDGSMNCYSGNLSTDPPAVRSLSGLERLGPALKDFSANYAQVSDLRPLAGLTGLTALRLGNNAITDVSPLAGLTGLTFLHLGDNAITDVSPLAGLTRLTWLSLGGNAIADVTPLAGLTALGNLDLPDNAVVDVAPLAGLTNLWWLNLSDNQVADIGPVAGIAAHAAIFILLDRNHVTDLSALSCTVQDVPGQALDICRLPSGGTVSASRQTASAQATVGVAPVPTVQPMVGDGPLVWSVVSGDARLDQAAGSVTYGSPGQVVLAWHGQTGFIEMRPAALDTLGSPAAAPSDEPGAGYVFSGTVTVDVRGATPVPTGRLSLSESAFTAFAGPCGGPDTVSPATITASVTVSDAAGAAGAGAGVPVAGVAVDFAVDAPLFIVGGARVTTGDDGVASVTVGLDPSSTPVIAVVPAVRASLAGVAAEGSPAPVSVMWLPYHATGPQEVTAAPSVGAGPVAADGSASWTVTAFHWLGCENLAGARFLFTVESGGALLSAPSTGQTGVTSLTVVAGADGVARVSVTDTTAEKVTISVQPLSAKLGTTLSGAPVTVEFVAPGLPPGLFEQLMSLISRLLGWLKTLFAWLF